MWQEYLNNNSDSFKEDNSEMLKSCQLWNVVRKEREAPVDERQEDVVRGQRLCRPGAQGLKVQDGVAHVH